MVNFKRLACIFCPDLVHVCLHVCETRDWASFERARQVLYQWTMNFAYFLLLLRFLFYMNDALHACMSVYHLCLMASGPMEPELQTVVSYHVGCKSSGKSQYCCPLSHLSIPPSYFKYGSCSVHVHVCGGQRHFCFFSASHWFHLFS